MKTLCLIFCLLLPSLSQSATPSDESQIYQTSHEYYLNYLKQPCSADHWSAPSDNSLLCRHALPSIDYLRVWAQWSLVRLARVSGTKFQDGAVLVSSMLSEENLSDTLKLYQKEFPTSKIDEYD